MIKTLQIAETAIIKLYSAAVPHGNYGDGEFGNRFADQDEGIIAIRAALALEAKTPVGEVQRYDLYHEPDNAIGCGGGTVMSQQLAGEYVLHSDYEALKAEGDLWKFKAEGLADLLTTAVASFDIMKERLKNAYLVKAECNDDANRERHLHHAYKQACETAGICMSCVLSPPEPYGCTDCLNTNWRDGSPQGFVPKAELDEAVRRRDEVSREHDAVHASYFEERKLRVATEKLREDDMLAFEAAQMRRDTQNLELKAELAKLRAVRDAPLYFGDWS